MLSHIMSNLASTTATMLGKRRRGDIDFDSDDDSDDDEFTKRQRTNAPTGGPGLLDMPTEILTRITSFLDWNEVLQFRATSRGCVEVIRATNISSLDLDMEHLKTSEITASTLDGFKRLKLIGGNTNVFIKTKVESDVDLRDHNRTRALNVASVLTTLNDCCRSVALHVAVDDDDKGSLFFTRVNNALIPGWMPSYNMHLVLKSRIAAPGSTEFLDRFKCEAVTIDNFMSPAIENAQPLSHCSMLRLINCGQFRPEVFSMMLQSCKTLFLEEWFSDESVANALSSEHFSCLAHCKTISFTKMCVPGELLRSLVACERLSLYHCRGYSDRNLFKLHRRGVVIDVDGYYWPRVPRPENDGRRFQAMFRAL